ncbi:tetratricopeptide repeat protein [Neochlamydia sp. S13]|uniref:tetratricopeptide repeat protein n=1 Tax=Neochlamydia sp. S13 TaxID=1353976 RepID=UPI0005A888AA|nr:tetratricopeptide repeat protein [Neochlamydia sp. S13]BBI17272.1 hypothetical protein NCS13_1_1077 [Neochlamydia sp. S13]BBI18205.1 hypothetical protein NCS13_2_0008 [Neochlamydia sp. S13]
MNVESSSITPFIFTGFRELVLAKPGLNLGPYTEISLKIFKELGQQDLFNARGVSKEWKQLIEQTEEWKKLYSKITEHKALEENQNTGDKSSLLSSFSNQWDNRQIARSLWYNPTAIIDDSIVAKVNAAADYLGKEDFKLKGVPSDGDCFFSAFLASYEQLSRKIPLLDESKDKVFYLRQVLSSIVKYTNNERAKKIKGKRTWISGWGEGDLLATALSIPIRLITVNEEQLACGIHDRLIFPKASLPMKDNSQEWKTIPEEEKLKEYVLIVDLGGHFIYAQKLLGQEKSFFLNQATSRITRPSKESFFYPLKEGNKPDIRKKRKRFLTTKYNLDKNDTFDPSNPLTTLPLEIFQQIFHSFSSLNKGELRNILDARRCARVFKQHMPNNVKFLQLYQPKRLQSYLDKLSNYLDKTLSSSGEHNTFLSADRLEEDYTHVLKLAIQKEDTIQIRLCIEKLGDIHLIKGTPQTLLQATGLYNYALHNASLDEQAIIKEKLSKVEILLSKACKGENVNVPKTKKQFENNRERLKKFRKEIEEKIQALGSDPSSEEVRELYGEIAQQIKFFFRRLAIQVFDILGPQPCEYAMIGFGSLAREEMTPYSDLEFGILMQEDTGKNREYFKYFTTLLHLKVINLGETILPALDIPCIRKANFFDSVTPRGFAFDGEGVQGKGCKTPFGNRQTFELIQPPNKMAEYIAQDEKGKWWHEKEPHLPMELLTFTHLLGNLVLTKEYSEVLKKKLDISYQEGFSLRQHLSKQHLVLDDMIAFNPGMADLQKEGMLFQVKNDFYRFPHLALDRLALLKNVEASDTFTRIDKLNMLGVVADSAADKLKDWMSIALFMRLKTYSHYQAQQHMMNPLIKPFGFDDPDLIKKQFALEQEALKKIKKIYCIFVPFHQAIQEFLAGHEDRLKSSNLEDNSPETQGNIARRLFQHKKAEEWYLLAENDNPNNAEVLNALGIIYLDQGNLDKAAEYSIKALAINLDLYGETYPTVARDYSNLGLIYKAQGNLDKATVYNIKALTIKLKVFGENHPTVAICYNNLGTLYRAQGNLDKAAEHSNKALAVNVKNYGENHPAVATNYNNLGQIYQAQGNLDKATEYCIKALNVDVKLYGESHPIVATNYNNLGQIYQAQGNLDKATEYCIKALNIDAKLYGESHPTVAGNYNNLGQICKEQGNLDKAIEYCKQALSINLDLYREIHPAIANLYNNLGQIYLEQGNLDKATEYSTKALNIDLKVYSENHPTVARDYNNLGEIYRHLGNLNMAAEYSNKALAIDLKLYGENHPEVAISYHNLGQIYKAQGNLDKAAEYSTKALKINLKHFGKNHPRVAIDYSSLGQIYQDQGSLDKAVEHYNKALAIDLKLYGENHPEMADCYSNLGTIYQNQGNLDKAIDYSTKALSINFKCFGENHPKVARDYSNLGQIYQDQGNTEKAAEHSTKALTIYLKLYGENHLTLAICYNNLGLIFKAQGNLEKAAEFSRKALIIDLAVYGENHPTVARDYNNLGTIYLDQGNLDKAVEYSITALTIDLKVYGENHPAIARDYNNLGAIYHNKSNLEKAAVYSNKALAIDLKLYGENHPAVARDYSNLGMIYKGQGNLELAAEYISKFIDINLKLYDRDHPEVIKGYNNLQAIYQSQENLRAATLEILNERTMLTSCLKKQINQMGLHML